MESSRQNAARIFLKEVITLAV